MPTPEPFDTALAGDLRAVAPRPAPEFRAKLDAQVAAGFPRPPRRRFALPALRPRLLVPALGTLGVGVVAVALALGGSSSDDLGSTASRPEMATEQAAPQAGGGAAADSAGSAVAPVAPPAATRQDAGDRRVERSARLELGAPAGRFAAVTDGVVRTTQRNDGFVASSQIARNAGQGTATFVLRVPSARLDAAMADLSRLGSVRAIEQSSQDLTGSYDSVSSQLDDARTQRRAIVTALATAEGREADRLRSRLATATSRVSRLEREQRTLRSRTSYATVDLTVVGGRGEIATPPDDGSWTPGDAWRDARRGLEVAAGVLIVVASFAIPVALLAALALWGTRNVRRRRRDAALDGA
jgi:hypothetical protein